MPLGVETGADEPVGALGAETGCTGATGAGLGAAGADGAVKSPENGFALEGAAGAACELPVNSPTKGDTIGYFGFVRPV